MPGSSTPNGEEASHLKAKGRVGTAGGRQSFKGTVVKVRPIHAREKEKQGLKAAKAGLVGKALR